mmetsp:Transcript_47163/g.74546  ORF Transcript_47163/g.74546 Transcript_47163/m.74546 type:complete len:225 (+) Transcript_47163:43-717(+)
MHKWPPWHQRHDTRRRFRGFRRKADLATVSALAIVVSALTISAKLSAGWVGFITSPRAVKPCAYQPRSALRLGSSVHVARRAVIDVDDALQFRQSHLSSAIRTVALVSIMGGVIAGSYLLTGKWWAIPLLFAVPSMLYRLWDSRLDTTRLAQISAAVDSKFVARTEDEQKELHSFMCGGCGYTLFPARGREAAFFKDDFKCPSCGEPKSAFVDLRDDAGLQSEQ